MLKVENNIIHLQLQINDNQLKFTEGGAPDLPPSVTNPAYTHSDQGRQLKVEKISAHLQLQIVDNQLKLTEGGNRWHRIGGSLQYAVCQSVAKQYGPYKIYCFIIY